MMPASTTTDIMPDSRFGSEAVVRQAARRFEHKYLVPESLLPPLRRLVARFASPDRHAARRGVDAMPGYVVRTIYLDTSRLKHYHEADEGLDVRAKPRIRGYGDADPAADVFLEIKRRRGAVGAKDRAPVAWNSLHRLLSTGDAERYVRTRAAIPRAVENACRFLFHLRRDALRPVLLVVYDREPYLGRFGPSLRITFDRRVRSVIHPSLDGLFEERGARPCLAARFVLEVKYDATFGFPAWLRPFIAEHGLVRQSLSKYWTCATDQGLARTSMARGFRAIA